jgi:tetratricopeptide (TPR) repeat protein
VVQEEATKLSKRAKRRAAGEGTSEGRGADEESTAAAELDDESAEGDDPKEDAAEEADGPGALNRQARRTAAAQARARRKRERAEASAVGLDAGEMVDDALVRFTDKLGRLARRYSNPIQWVVGLGVLGWLGYQVYTWRSVVVAAEVSDALFEAVAIEDGRIGDPKEQGVANANGVIDPTPIFETDAARLQAALVAYEKAATLRTGSGGSSIARLAHAGILFELGRNDEALVEFEQVASSEPAAGTPELRGHALEGRGLSLEAKSDLPGALKAFEELANVPSFENRALYQQARIKHLLGDDAGSRALLVNLFKALGAPKAPSLTGLPDRPDFLRERAVQLTSVVDPLEKDVKIPKPPLGTDAVQQMLEQLKASGVVTPPTP